MKADGQYSSEPELVDSFNQARLDFAETTRQFKATRQLLLEQIERAKEFNNKALQHLLQCKNALEKIKSTPIPPDIEL